MHIFDVINVLSLFFVKPCIALMVVLFCTRSSSMHSPHSRHWLLVCMCLLMFICISTAWLLPTFNLSILVANTESMFVEDMLGIQVAGRSISVFNALLGVYLLGVAALLSHFVSSWTDAYLLVRRARKINVLHCDIDEKHMPMRCHFYESHELTAPVAWGVFNQKVLLPLNWRTWHSERLQRVLQHELSHLKRQDWLIKNCLSVCRVLFWYLPPMWFVCQRAGDLAEFACDDRVVSESDCRADYAEDLVRISFQAKSHAIFVNMASSVLAYRIQMVLDGARDRSVPSLSYKFFSVILALVLFVPLFFLTLEHKQLVKKEVFYTLPFNVVDTVEDRPIKRTLENYNNIKLTK